MIPKFRVWNNKTQAFIDYGDVVLDLASGKIFAGDVGVMESTIDVTDHVELMQSTGLKDKNGVEIFEGDIVKNTYNQKIRRVFWNPNRTAFELSEVGHESSRTEYWSLFNAKWSYEIIGHVWENPELLEGAKQ